MLLIIPAQLLAVEYTHVAESIAKVRLADLALGPSFGTTFYLSFDPLSQTLGMSVLHRSSAFTRRNNSSLVLALQTDATLSNPLPFLLAVANLRGKFFIEPNWYYTHMWGIEGLGFIHAMFYNKRMENEVWVVGWVSQLIYMSGEEESSSASTRRIRKKFNIYMSETSKYNPFGPNSISSTYEEKKIFKYNLMKEYIKLTAKDHLFKEYEQSRFLGTIILGLVGGYFAAFAVTA